MHVRDKMAIVWMALVLVAAVAAYESLRFAMGTEQDAQASASQSPLKR